MAKPPLSGVWRAQFTGEPYTDARVWGTGINPVHEISQGLPVRVTGHGTAPRVPPSEGIPDELIGEDFWGYQPEDSGVNDYVDYDEFSRLDSYTFGTAPSYPASGAPSHRGHITAGHPAWNIAGEAFRALKLGAHRYRQKLTNLFPSETVSEGWVNKPKGQQADSRTSDPVQYERQTSMQQRYQKRENTAAVNRQTDEPRAAIASRVTGQKLKIYSGGERHYDMVPQHQDLILRPFYARTAGTGRIAEMQVNEQYVIVPIQRVPPADPGTGHPETSQNVTSPDYGYTSEDQQYYA